MNKNNDRIGIIGGSGMDDPQILEGSKTCEIETPYGKTSDKLTIGKIGGKEVVVVARHAKGHNLMPTRIPFRANIWALKEMGCQAILATTACGSLRENYWPGELVLIDQVIDFTRLRELTFFADEVKHTAMPEPFDRNLRKKLMEAATSLGLPCREGGTMITIEGPRFSTKAESKMFQIWGADLINMSTVPEVVLANELGVPYQAIAMVTDYDCWKDNEEAVTFEMILKRMEENADKVKRLLVETVRRW